MTSNQRWVSMNVSMLQNIYGEVTHAGDYIWVSIKNFVLPECFHQQYSVLLMLVPIHDLSICDGFSFYLDKQLGRNDGMPLEHLFDDHDYNDLRHNGYSKLSYHLNNTFVPSLDVTNGDTLIDICKGIFYFLGDKRGVGQY